MVNLYWNKIILQASCLTLSLSDKFASRIYVGNWTNFVSYSLSVPTHKYGRRQFKLPILFYFSNFAIQHFNLFHSPSMRRNDTNNKFLLSVMKCFSKKQRLTTTRTVSISLDRDYWRKLTILLSKPNKFRSLDQFSWLS